jgi:hypothetical protein
MWPLPKLVSDPTPLVPGKPKRSTSRIFHGDEIQVLKKLYIPTHGMSLFPLNKEQNIPISYPVPIL